MIGEQTVAGYFTQVVVLSQPLLWMWIYDRRIRCPEDLKYYFYLNGFGFILFVIAGGVQVGFYTTGLLVQYALLTMVATFFYNQHNSIKEAISLAFLTVFLNSFYWEIPLHLAELFSGPPHLGMLVQLWRLFPAIWFLKKYTFNEESYQTLTKGLLFSFLLTGAAAYVEGIPGRIVHVVVRFGCLLVLVKVVMRAKPRDV